MPRRSEWEILDRLFTVVRQRQRRGDPGASYVARLFQQGRARIAQKVGEEGLETALAGALGKRRQVASESADLLFMLLVLWAELGLTPADVLAELKRREGVSGLEEKASRKKPRRGGKR
ncbi:MAG: phosphoribosyl-ATP diphosphatase [Alphaproteobacteria bacterium]|nr:phosphoribosyl-ATP diphosphatase [Alphaproteobacteria bacterium]